MVRSTVLRRIALACALVAVTLLAGALKARAQADICSAYYTIDIRNSVPNIAFPLFLAVNLEDNGGTGVSIPHTFKGPTSGPQYYSLPSGYHVVSVQYNGATVPADGQPHKVYLVECHCCITITVNPDSCPVSIVVEELGDCD